MKTICWLFGLVLAISAFGAQAMEPIRTDQEGFLSRAVFAEGRLWLLSDSGELSSITPGAHERIAEALAEPAYDLCVHDGHAVMAAGPRDEPKAWTLRQRVDGAWTDLAVVPTQGEVLIAMDCSGAEPLLLTTERLLTVKAGGIATLRLADPLAIGLVTSIHVTPDAVFIGLNAGEWGGGLRRISRGNGEITTIQAHATSNPCDGPLSISCDPVNGVVADPWKPDCVIAAIGLVHFMAHGRLVDVCGSTVAVLFSRPYQPPTEPSEVTFGGGTVAFFGLATKGDSVWAAGIDGLYRLQKGRAAEPVPLPQFEDVDGMRVSFDVPGFALVMTRINARRSISGQTPMLVPMP